MRLGENFCPGILHAVPAKDGQLIRIRVPGGLISAAQLAAVASLAASHANGEIELTSRSNLQLRAIQPSSLPYIVTTLTEAGLLPSSAHDRVRNLVTSPFAGIDPAASLDTRPLIRALDQRLIANDLFLQLHPKFTFGIEANPTRFTYEVEDLGLQAFDSTHRLSLSLAGKDTGCSVAPEDAVVCLLTAAEACIDLAKQHNVPVRTKRLTAIPGVLETLLKTLSPLLEPTTNPARGPDVRRDVIGPHPALTPGHLNLVPSIPLGHLTASQATNIATLATQHNADLHLAPWRGIVLGNLTPKAAALIAPQLAALGLPLDATNGFEGIAACAGISRCDASLADVRADAARLATYLATRPHIPGWTIHLSGCEKQCALRHSASAALIATPAGYTLRLPNHPEAHSLPSAAAIASILQSHTEALAS
ncbi:precorrin-3B synthase [Granulicella tundricola]|uniref:Precorrin-3B synthase n=1 Tax=Granulicella tundricola (strain ATCC BAA-1859 / DSM 23138 / MP5ACTX9) TaxID=1198114 RepID=E8X6S1_GRATM|nr:precorrin-3B synthase [Granulicella tundricola]ADW71221.1 precorrin-3B synthase [Granulicella tundricola MP5ACTX9]